MAQSLLNTSLMQDYLERWQAGDRDAANDLLRIVIARLEKLARKMLRAFPNVRVHTETDDLLQNSIIRLLHALRRMKVATTRDFYNLAAVHVRRELLDLARAKRKKRPVPIVVDWVNKPESETPITTEDFDIELWIQFHKGIDCLPLEEREVAGLIFYHGWTHARIAELFQVDDRTIRRRWHSAKARLQKLVGADLLDR